MNNYNYITKDLPRMLDVSAVQAQSGIAEVKKTAELALKYGCICVFALPVYTEYMGELVKGSSTLLGGTVGFPSGADTTSLKVACAEDMVKLGCGELDMVISVGALKSGNYEHVVNDIKAIREIAGERVLKAIIEVSLLTDDEILKASELAVKGGVDFVKSGTGWQGPTTVEHIKLMKKAVGNDVKIKAAGGVRDLATIDAMIREGCTRFGVGITSVIKIMDEYNKIFEGSSETNIADLAIGGVAEY